MHSLAVPWLFLSANSINLTINNETTYVSYPGDFECSGEPVVWEINVAEEGVGVAVLVSETHLDPENGEHLVLSAGESTFMVGCGQGWAVMQLKFQLRQS